MKHGTCITHWFRGNGTVIWVRKKLALCSWPDGRGIAYLKEIKPR